MMGHYMWSLIREDTCGHKRKPRSNVHFGRSFSLKSCVLMFFGLVISKCRFECDSRVQVNFTKYRYELNL